MAPPFRIYCLHSVDRVLAQGIPRKHSGALHASPTAHCSPRPGRRPRSAEHGCRVLQKTRRWGASSRECRFGSARTSLSQSEQARPLCSQDLAQAVILPRGTIPVAL